MKKFIIFLLLLSMCGDTSTSEVEPIPESNEVIEDSLITEQESNIPPLPTVSFDIIEIYETKLGTELCSDATEIDSTTEECLRQYRDNLEFVFSYAEDLPHSQIQILNCLYIVVGTLQLLNQFQLHHCIVQLQVLFHRSQ